MGFSFLWKQHLSVRGKGRESFHLTSSQELGNSPFVAGAPPPLSCQVFTMATLLPNKRHSTSASGAGEPGKPKGNGNEGPTTP